MTKYVVALGSMGCTKPQWHAQLYLSQCVEVLVNGESFISPVGLAVRVVEPKRRRSVSCSRKVLVACAERELKSP